MPGAAPAKGQGCGPFSRGDRSAQGTFWPAPHAAGLTSPPVVVLTSDKRFDFGAGGSEAWPAWRAAQDRLAKLLRAKHVSETNSGHAIQMEQPQLVIGAIRQVVEAVRSPASWKPQS